MMELIDNISLLLGSAPKETIRLGAEMKITSFCFDASGSKLIIRGLRK